MSTTVDSRVVEMQFNNQNFERNVSTSLGTLDKLKRSLNLSGASKGLENVNAAAKNCNLSPLGSAVETVKVKFSALEVIAVTALANITNSVVNAGKQFVSALTIDPIKDGFSEYEMTLNAVQTTMAGTGKTAEEVEEELKKLDEYADKTIYSSADMFNNLPKFTNAGVELEKATTAMIGIANATALAGGDASKASIAFYNLGQAIGTGYLTRMDYNSINNAGMATMEWKNQMVEAAVAAGTLTKAGDDLYEAGGKTFTLQQLFIDGLQEQWATTDVMMKVFGDYGDETTEIGKKAYGAAQDIKTFSMMMESLQATAGTGWKDTWQLIFGGLEDAKVFWTSLSESISGVITKIADFRNGLLESALGKTITGLGDSLKAVGKVTEPIKEVTTAVKDLGDIVDKVIIGDFGNGADRIKALTDAGYDYAAVQNKVNEKLGVAFRHTEKLTEAQEGSADSTQEQTDATVELNDEEKDRLKGLLKMSEAELKSKGYTDEQIEALRELGEQAKNLGIPIDDFIDNLDELNGRFILINGFKNIGKALVKVFQALGEAWNNVFDPPTMEEQADGLFNIITAFSRFTSKLIPTEEAAEKLTKTFEGLFAIIDIILTVTGGGLKFAFEILKAVLEVLGIDILDVTAAIGDAIVKFKEWLENTIDLSGVIDTIAPAIANAVKSVYNWVKENVNLVEGFKSVVSAVKGAIDSIRDWIISLKDSENLPKDIADGIINAFGKVAEFLGDTFSGLWNGLTNGFAGLPDDMISGFVNGLWEGIQVAGQVMLELGKAILEKIKEVLGIHSPSTEFFEIGANIIQGLVNGIKDTAAIAWDALKKFAEECINVVSRIDFGKVLAGAIGVGMTAGLVKIGNAIEAFASPFEGLGDMFRSVGKVMNSFSGVLKSYSASIKAGALKDVAIAIAILVGSIVVLTLLDTGKVWGAIGVLAVLAVGLIAVSAVLGKLGSGSAIDFGKLSIMLIAVSIAMVLMAKAVKTIGELDENALSRGLGAIVLFGLVIAALILIARLPGNDFDKVGAMILKVSIAMLLLVWVAKIAGGMDPAELTQGLLAIGVFTIFMGVLVGITKIAGKNVDKLGSTLLKMSFAILVLVAVAKIISTMDPEDLAKGLIGILAFTVVIGALLLVTRLAGGSMAEKLGSTLLAISVSIGILALVAVLLGSMSVSSLVKGIAAVAALSAIVIALIVVIELCNGNEAKIASTLLAISISIGILAAIAILLGLIEIPMLAKGIIAVGLLAGLMALMIAATKNATSCTGNIVAMAVSIAVMATAVAALSFIETESLAAATGALVLLMGMFAVLIKASGSAKGSIGMLVTLVLAVGLLAGILYMLAQLPINGTLEAAASLSLLVIALSVSLVLLSKFSGNAAKALTGILALTAMAVPLLAFVGVLALMDGLQNAMTNAIVLGAFVTTLTVLLAVLTIVGSFAVAALVGVLALTAMAIPLLAFIGILALMENLQNATANVLLLSAFLTTITSVMVILALIGPMALIGVAAMGALTLLMGAIGTFAVAIGALFTQFPQLEEFLNTGLPILEQLALSIGTMIGNFVSGMLTSIADSLPHIGECLTQFMENASGFISGAKEVDDKVLAGVSILALAILELTVVDLINGLASLLSFGDNFSSLGTELSTFMNNAGDFIKGAKSMSSTSMDGVKALAEVILILTGAQILDGLTSWFTGGSSLSAFAEDLEPFGTAMSNYSKALSAGGAFNAGVVNASANAAKAIAELANNLPKSGGWLQGILGETISMDDFGTQLEGFATSMVKYSKALSAEGAFDASVVESSANAASALAELANNLPKSGGWLQGILGETMTMDDFGEDLESFAASMVAFSNTITDNGGIDSDAVEAAANAGTTLNELAQSLPTTGGWLQAIIGETMTMEDFGADLEAFATSMVNFSNTITANGGINADAVDAAVYAGEALSALANGLPKEDGWLTNIFGGGQTSLEDFGNDLAAFGTAISGFSVSVADVNTSKLSSVINQVMKLAEFAQLASDINTDGLTKFSNALKSMGDAGITTFVEGLDDCGAQVAEAGGRLIDALIAGVALKSVDLILAFGSMATSAVDALSADTSFAAAGQVVATQFLSGMKNNQTEVESAGKSVATQFSSGVKNNQTEVESAGNTIVTQLTTGIKDKETPLHNTGRAIIKYVLDAIRSRYDSIKSVGQTMMTKLIDGLTSKKTSAEENILTVIDGVRSKIRGEYGNYKKAGKYLVEGFVAGIDENTFAAEAKAAAMAEAALEAVEEALRINSPSKETYKLGDYFGMGFVNALSDYEGTAFDAAYVVADNAKRGLSGAITKIKDFIDSDIDRQPTIRPVLDLSGVQSGVGTLNGMFGVTPSMGVLANVGSISAMMNSNQNGTNDDVVSAIKDLGDRIGEMSGDSYNLGNVTYDDGSNVSNAVKSLVRATRIERRR